MNKRIILAIVILIIMIVLLFPSKKEMDIIKYQSNHNADSVVFVDINKDTFVIYKSRYVNIIKK